ncbi:MAG: hypothetical protein ACJ79H_09835 [Myxococcales bacterium]
MIDSQSDLASISSSELLARTHKLVALSHGLEADLLLHLGEIDDRRLYLERTYRSMFAFCIGELGFSEAAAYDRIMVARAGRQLPSVIEALRSGRVHLTGLRLLAPHLTPATNRELLAQAAGKTKREIEELVARLAPQPPVPSVVRKIPERARLASADPPLLAASAAPVILAQRENHRPTIAPLSEGTFKIQFTASRALRKKLGEAQDLLPPGTRWRPGLDFRESARPAHRLRHEGSLRDPPEIAWAIDASRRWTAVPAHPGRDQARRL